MRLPCRPISGTPSIVIVTPSDRPRAYPTSRSRQSPEVVLAAPLEVAQLRQGGLDVPAALLQLGPPVADLAEQVAQLTGLAGLLVVHVHDGADLLQGEAEPLASQYELQPDPVARVEHPDGAASLRRDQADVLVVADRAVRDAELLGDLRD